MNNIKSKRKRQSSYIPDPALVDFLEERLHLLKKQRAGEKLTLEDSKLKRNNDRRKVYVLNTHIFPSMATLIAFFEYMKNNPELQKDFEEDIQELLFGVGPDSTPAFARFFSNAMQWNDEKDPNNFRLILLEQIQGVITTKIMALTGGFFKNGITNELRILIFPDMMRAWNWVKVYSRGASIAADTLDMTDSSRPLLY